MAESADLATVTKMTGMRASIRRSCLVDVQAGLVGQAQVEENDVRASGGDPLQALCARLGHLDPVRGGGEHVAHRSRSRSGSSSISSKVAMRREPPRNCKILKLRWSLYQSVTKQSVP